MGASLPNGGQLGEYLLEEELGKGGFGAVYRARHRRLKRLVAVKVLHPKWMDDDEVRGRFEREMEIVARLDHPNLVRAHDAGEAAGHYYLVMEYLEGTALDKYLRARGRLSVESACRVIVQAAAGLQHAHDHGLVHRDVKPANLYLCRRPESDPGPVVKILDLGLARLQEETDSGGLTATGIGMGTTDYMAPEQFEHARGVDIRADIYSLGCTLYHLLVGAPPFPGGSAFQKYRAHRDTTPPPLGDARPDVPPGLAAVVDRMMAKSPDDRYATPAEVAAALRPYARSGTGGAAPARTPPPPRAEAPIGETRTPTQPFRAPPPVGDPGLRPAPGARAAWSARGTPLWVWVVILLYTLPCIGLVVFLLGAAAVSINPNDQVTSLLVLAGFVLIQAGLLAVPVRFARGKPIRRVGLWPMIAVSGVLFSAMTYLMATALAELASIKPDDPVLFLPAQQVVLDIAGVSWLAWTAIFTWLARRADDPAALAFRIHRVLLRSSVLELLVIEVAHLIVRQRKVCFAGLGTGIALAMSLPLALLAFGPGVVVLYLRRVRRVSVPGYDEASRRRRLAWAAGTGLAFLVAAAFLVYLILTERG